MKHRTWLLEALHLHFDENLARVEAGRRLGIPKTTVCDLFVRFRKAGLSWPLPPPCQNKNWMSVFTAPYPAHRQCLWLPLRTKSRTPESASADQTSRERSKSHWSRNHCSQALMWPSLHAKTALTITCCSTGAAFTGRACCFHTTVSRHCFLSCCPPNRAEPSPFRPPGRKIRPVKHCAANWFFLPVP